MEDTFLNEVKKLKIEEKQKEVDIKLQELKDLKNEKSLSFLRGWSGLDISNENLSMGLRIKMMQQNISRIYASGQPKGKISFYSYDLKGCSKHYTQKQVKDLLGIK